MRSLQISYPCQKVLDRAQHLFEDKRITRAQKLLADHRPGWMPDERVRSLLLEGECLIRLKLLREAYEANKAALIAARKLELTAKDPLRISVAKPFIILAIAMLSAQEHQGRIMRFLGSLGRSPLYGLDFLRQVAGAMRFIQYREHEVLAWESYLQYPLLKKERWSALIEKGIVLLICHRYREAKCALHTATRLRPREYHPYGLLAAIAAMEGDLKEARYFCNSSWETGNRTKPYLRDRFLILISEEQFSAADETLQLLIENPRDTLESLFSHIFLIMHPKVLALCEVALPKFEAYLTKTRRRLSHKIQVFLKMIGGERTGAREIYDHSRAVTLPLVRSFWEIDTRLLDDLCYEECLRQLEPYSEEEVRVFREQYENIIDQPSFENYVNALRKRRRIVGITLLVASQVIDMLADVLEEYGVAFQGTVRFDPNQLTAFTFLHGHGLVFGWNIVHLGDADAIRQSFREQISKDATARCINDPSR